MIDYIFCYIMCFLMNFLLIYFLNKVLLIKRKNNFLIIIMVSCIFFISNLFKSQIAKHILLLSALTFEFNILISKNIKDSIIYSFVCYMHLIMYDVLTEFFVEYMIKNYYNLFITNLMLFKNISSLNFCVILFIISNCKSYTNLINKIIGTLQKINKKIYNICSLIIMILIYVFMSIILYNGTLNYINIIYIFLYFFLSNIMLFFIFIYIYKNHKIHQTNEMLENMNNVYGNLIDEDNKIKHNLKNQLLIIRTLGNNKTKKYVDSILDSKIQIKNSNNLYKIPKSLKGIFGEKLFNLKRTTIIVNNNIKGNYFDTLSIKTYGNLCEILSICLDNVLEAIKEIKKPYIYINFSEIKNDIYIVIKNNFNGTIDIDNLGTKKYSTKNRGSGYGLYSINKIKDINTSYSLNENEFTTKIIIKKSKVR